MGEDSRALIPTERLVAAAGAGALDPGPFEEFVWAYGEHLYALVPRTDVRGPYRGAVQELENLPCLLRLVGIFNPASLAKTLG